MYLHILIQITKRVLKVCYFYPIKVHRQRSGNNNNNKNSNNNNLYLYFLLPYKIVQKILKMKLEYWLPRGITTEASGARQQLTSAPNENKLVSKIAQKQ